MKNGTSVLLAAAMPVVVFFVVGTAMSIVTGRQAALAHAHPPDLKPLNMRISYNVDDVDRFWGALGANGLTAEQRFLKADLLFPTIYGGALAASLWWLCRLIGWSVTIPLAAVTIGAVADWTENLVQLELLRRYAQTGRAGLDPHTVQIASVATLVKLAGVSAAFLLLLILAVLAIARRPA